ncbi:hypothetical protein D3C87_1544910 [compost metagenome]
MLLLNRRDAAAQHENTKTEAIGWKIWKIGMLKRKRMDGFSGKLKNFFLKLLFKKIWGKYRAMPEVAPKSFAKLWEEQNKDTKSL